MRSKDYNNIGFREGFAHFIAARTWSNKASEAAFKWFESSMWHAARAASSVFFPTRFLRQDLRSHRRI
jgi:hypothetical protein